ncbi:MAG TPA: histidine kinase [Casimicrobiaceae bacterium]|jgi:hypothetical protein|nr:histidine kinase [Casimicrobiaceae bacterium]
MTAVSSRRWFFSGPWLAAQSLAAAWRRVSGQHVRVAMIFGLLVSVMHLAGGLVAFRDYGFGNALRTVLSDQLGAFSVMLSVVVADYFTGGDGQRRWIYIVAVLSGAAVWALLEYAGFRALGMGIRWYPVEEYQYSIAVEITWRTGYGFLEWLLLGGAATFIFLDARRARIEQRRLRSAEIERARTAKRMLESELQALQARVEPQFLFNTMAQVRKLYAVDARLAERMLDDLIAYLRAAMPHMRNTTSTVACEMELARAYLDIVKMRLADRLCVEFVISRESTRGSMPPMMLLPLIDHAIACEYDHSGSRRTLRISSEVAAGRLRLRIADSASGLGALKAGGEISSIRERLTALYGAGARLEFVFGGEASLEARMELPFEAIEDGRDWIEPGSASHAEHAP